MKYIDSSAFVKYYCDESSEKGARKVKELIENVKRGNEQLICSVILLGEVVSAFDKRVRMRILTLEQFEEAAGEFAKDIKKLVENNLIIFEAISLIKMTFTVDYVVKYHLSVNDALHLYAALANKDKTNGFVSADKTLNAAAKAEGLNVFNPED